ncbi:MAG: hypothetical protein AB1758_07920, partial [Candidatus Eremiobacterota bacterium]
LSEGFDAFVLQGIFRFQDLAVYDTRERYRLIGREVPRLLLFTDKEELFWVCREVSDRFKISSFCSGGPPSLVSSELIARDLARRQARNLRVAALTDYDPVGRDLAFELGYQLSSSVFGFQSVHTTVLSTPDLFAPRTLERAGRPLLARGKGRREMSRSRVEPWLQQTGGLNGEPVGLPIELAEPGLLLARITRWYEENTRATDGIGSRVQPRGSGSEKL